MNAYASPDLVPHFAESVGGPDRHSNILQGDGFALTGLVLKGLT